MAGMSCVLDDRVLSLISVLVVAMTVNSLRPLVTVMAMLVSTMM